jgi:hypothetical protein
MGTGSEQLSDGGIASDQGPWHGQAFQWISADAVIDNIAVGLSLAYIGTASGTGFSVSLELDRRRFRLGDKKEAAGAAVAVMLVGIMDIEWRLVIHRGFAGRR